MKSLVNVFLFIFIAFLSTPSLVGLIDKKADTSCFYTMCEEEENHISFNEIKSVPLFSYAPISFVQSDVIELNVLVEHDLSFTNLAHQIFSPPPNIL